MKNCTRVPMGWAFVISCSYIANPSLKFCGGGVFSTVKRITVSQRFDYFGFDWNHSFFFFGGGYFPSLENS